jgi:hypothetical protein
MLLIQDENIFLSIIMAVVRTAFPLGVDRDRKHNIEGNM